MRARHCILYILIIVGITFMITLTIKTVIDENKIKQNNIIAIIDDKKNITFTTYENDNIYGILKMTYNYDTFYDVNNTYFLIDRTDFQYLSNRNYQNNDIQITCIGMASETTIKYMIRYFTYRRYEYGQGEVFLYYI